MVVVGGRLNGGGCVGLNGGQSGREVIRVRGTMNASGRRCSPTTRPWLTRSVNGRVLNGSGTTLDDGSKTKSQIVADDDIDPASVVGSVLCVGYGLQGDRGPDWTGLPNACSTE